VRGRRKKEPDTHCLRMLSSPRIFGILEISVKPVRYTYLRETCRLFLCERCLPLTTLCVDDDEGSIKAISSLLTEMKGTEVPNPQRSSACGYTCVLTRNRSLSRDSLILAMRILFYFCLCKIRSQVYDAL